MGHILKVDFRENAKKNLHKRRRVPLQLQHSEDQNIKNLLNAGHIRKVDKLTHDMFFQPVVITAKKDRSVKIALDTRSLNNAIQKNTNCQTWKA